MIDVKTNNLAWGEVVGSNIRTILILNRHKSNRHTLILIAKKGRDNNGGQRQEEYKIINLKIIFREAQNSL